MAKFNLVRGRHDVPFYIKFHQEGLYSAGGIVEIPINKWLVVKHATNNRDKNLLVIGSTLVKKEDIYDFLCDEGKEVVSGPSESDSYKLVRSPDGGLYRQTVSGV